MKRLLMLTTFCFMALGPALWAIPSTINYQGTLKEKGLPANGTRQMLFRITNQDGTQVYWSASQVPVTVANGLFSAQINPTGVDWQSVTPYIEVSVEGQLLLPREPINATIYASVSNNVVDGAITQVKLSASVAGELVPTGMIAMFSSGCPQGWIIFSDLQGKFPVGADGTNFMSGTPGGNMAHSHTVNLSPHTHPISNSTLQVAIGIRNIDFDNFLAMQAVGGVGSFSQFTANQWYGYGNGMTKPAPVGSNPGDVSVIGPRISGGTNVAQFSGSNTTDSQSNLPPYMGMVFCQKQ